MMTVPTLPADVIDAILQRTDLRGNPRSFLTRGVLMLRALVTRSAF